MRRELYHSDEPIRKHLYEVFEILPFRFYVLEDVRNDSLKLISDIATGRNGWDSWSADVTGLTVTETIDLAAQEVASLLTDWLQSASLICDGRVKWTH